MLLCCVIGLRGGATYKTTSIGARTVSIVQSTVSILVHTVSPPPPVRIVIITGIVDADRTQGHGQIWLVRLQPWRARTLGQSQLVFTAPVTCLNVRLALPFSVSISGLPFRALLPICLAVHFASKPCHIPLGVPPTVFDLGAPQHRALLHAGGSLIMALAASTSGEAIPEASVARAATAPPAVLFRTHRTVGGGGTAAALSSQGKCSMRAALLRI